MIGAGASVLLALVTAVLLLMPVPKAPVKPPQNFDKLVHFTLFFAMVLPGLSVAPRHWVWAAPLAIGYGVVMEVIQPYFGRGFDWWDMLANSLGVICAVPVAWWVNARWLERREARQRKRAERDGRARQPEV